MTTPLADAIAVTVPMLLHAPVPRQDRDAVLQVLLAWRDDVDAAGVLSPEQDLAGRLELAAVWAWLPCFNESPC
jgi:hypothetical protein